VVVAPTIVHRSFAIAAMPEGSQKFASESIFNFNFIFKLKFEFRLWEHLGNRSHKCLKVFGTGWLTSEVFRP